MKAKKKSVDQLVVDEAFLSASFEREKVKQSLVLFINKPADKHQLIANQLTDISFLPLGVISDISHLDEPALAQEIGYTMALAGTRIANDGSENEHELAVEYYPNSDKVFIKGLLAGVDNSTELTEGQKTDLDAVVIGVTDTQVVFHIANAQGELAKTFEKLRKSGGLKSTEDCAYVLNQPYGKFESNVKGVPSSKQSLIQAIEKGKLSLKTLLKPSKAQTLYDGWDLSPFKVSKAKRTSNKQLTLMTIEPDSGFYQRRSALAFMHQFGTKGSAKDSDKISFSHKYTVKGADSDFNLTLDLVGFDQEKGRITHPQGGVVLHDADKNIIISWSFSRLLEHWKQKCDKSLIIPYEEEKSSDGKLSYKVLGAIESLEGISFVKFLEALMKGDICYVPLHKLENAFTGKPKLKLQHRLMMKQASLPVLFAVNEKISINTA